MMVYLRAPRLQVRRRRIVRDLPILPALAAIAKKPQVPAARATMKKTNVPALPIARLPRPALAFPRITRYRHAPALFVHFHPRFLSRHAHGLPKFLLPHGGSLRLR